MAQAGVSAFLSEQKRSTDKEIAAEWGIMEELYNEKWDRKFLFVLIEN